MIVVFLLMWVVMAFADCEPCDSSCGNWSCITNCSSSSSNPAFDTYRCAVDGNGNGMVDDCSELPACQQINGKYVCPTDTGDSLCVSSEWQGPYPYDSNPQDFDAPIWGFYLTTSQMDYPTYQQKLSQYSLSCPQPPPNSSDPLYQYALSSLPLWVCGGAFYSDAWLSYDSCSYISYDGAQWQVKNNACSDPNKIWQKLGSKCYGVSWQHSIYVYATGQYFYLTWNVPVPQGSFNQDQYVNVSGQSYRVNMQCVASQSVQDAKTGQSIQLCTQFIETVYDPSGNVLYTLYWYPDTTWSCPVAGGTQNTSYTQETMTPISTGSFTGVVLERPNNTSLRGAGVDTQGNRCRICATSMQGLSGGVLKVYPDIDKNIDSWDKLAQCVNPRFFGGDVRTCRPGGITVLGASCCGISGWTKNMCSKGEKELKKRRQAGTCHEVGEYCSKKVLGVCLEKKRSYCCFYSELSRIFNECGRPQVGKGWGSPKNPDCSGFTIDEFSKVDFSDPVCMQAIEEWANEMAQKLGDSISQEISSRAVDGVQSWLNNVKNQSTYEGEK